MPMTRTSRLPGTVLLALALAACGQQPASEAATPVPDPAPVTTATPIAVPTARAPYALMVSTDKSDSVQGLEREFGGRVVAFSAQAGYALLAVDSAQLPVVTQGAGGKARSRRVVEPNQAAFDGGGVTAMQGRRTLWAGGEFRAWTGGRRTLWAGGSYAPVPENSVTWGQVRLQQAQRLAPHLGAGVKVAVIDTGLDLTHPAFEGALAPQGEWWDFYGNDALPQDEGALGIGGYGHGTSVAGIVLQVAPNATILPLRVLGPDGSGDILGVAKAIDWAVKHGARVINLSLGSDERSQIVQDAIERATRSGVFVVASAGNENTDPITYPARDAAGKGNERELSVGSVDARDVKSSFSNYGSALEVVAPGEDVFGPAPRDANGVPQLAAWSGTSMAAPMAAGGLALALGESDKKVRGDLAQKMSARAHNVYGLPGNRAYRTKLGVQGRLDLEAFLRDVLGLGDENDDHNE
ncbi:peptidase S8 and S53 subtilisin kexin sedolisin [Deinococcus aerius]|uniref:Peptidase S8 and S53 subtilisin kexin sedolisin n=2 Tax=Deinococcus aerius TaxID=200253 RepID=A0A2I9CSD7_9DEIO|nr:peptidase S8 and S53 subtilisin kexin sedolisin [Deinococcus aerius]